MNLFQEIKLLFTAKSTVEEIVREARQMDGITPGWKTTEFYLNLATQVGTLWGAVSGFIPAKTAAIISAIGIGLYTVARTILKVVTDVKAVNAPDVVPTPAPAA